MNFHIFAESSGIIHNNIICHTMMKKAQIGNGFFIQRRLYSLFLFLLCFYNLSAQIYVSEGTTLVVGKTTIITDSIKVISSKEFADIYSANEEESSLSKEKEHLATKAKPPVLEVKKEAKPKPQPPKHKDQEFTHFVSTDPEHQIVPFRKTANSITIPVNNLVMFFVAPYLAPEVVLTFFNTLPQALPENYKNIPFYSFSVIRPPPSNII